MSCRDLLYSPVPAAKTMRPYGTPSLKTKCSASEPPGSTRTSRGPRAACQRATRRAEKGRSLGKGQALSSRWSVAGNSLQSRSGSRVIESWQNVLVYLPPTNGCQAIHTVSHSAAERLMRLQSIYEDFCFEDSLLGNRVKTRMDELSFISAGASCEN